MMIEDHSWHEGKIVKLPVILGSIGTGLAFALENVSKLAGALAGVLTCIYLSIQIFYKLKHERNVRRGRKMKHDDR